MKLDTNSMRDYDIACALRGPDLANTGNLKFALTCRIRHLVGCYYAPARRERVTLGHAEAALAEAVARRGELKHYLNHVYQAASHLGDGGLRVLTLALIGGRPLTPEGFVKLAGGD